MLKLAGARIVGILSMVDSTSPFDRGSVVIQGADGTYLNVREYPDAETATGSPYVEGDIQTLRGAGQLLMGEPVPAAYRAAGWVLRGDFDELRRLLRAFKLVLGAFGTGKDLMGYIIREDAVALSLREAWAAASRLQAIKALRANDLNMAISHARCALSFYRELPPDVIALIAFVYARLGQQERAMSYKLLAQRSWGDAFLAKVEVAWLDLEHMLYG